MQLTQRTYLTVVLAIVALFNQGCATNSSQQNYVWYMPGASAEQTRRDLAACQNEALVNGRAYSPIPANTVGQAIVLGMFASSAENNRENQIVQTCMIAKGYSLIKKSSLMNTVPIEDVNILKIQKDKAERGDVQAQFDLGNLYYTGYTNNVCAFTADYTESIKWFQKAADQNYPNIQLPLASALVHRAIQRQKEGNFDGALMDCNDAIKIIPTASFSYSARATIKTQKSDFAGALVDYDRIIEINSTNPTIVGPAYHRKGILNYILKKYNDAYANFQQACAYDPKNCDYYYFYIWLIREHWGDRESANKELQSYMENRKNGTNEDWQSKIGHFLIGQLTEQQLFSAAENSNSKTEQEQLCEAFFYAGSKRLIEGDKTGAEDDFQKCKITGCKEFEEYICALAELKNIESHK